MGKKMDMDIWLSASKQSITANLQIRLLTV